MKFSSAVLFVLFVIVIVLWFFVCIFNDTFGAASKTVQWFVFIMGIIMGCAIYYLLMSVQRRITTRDMEQKNVNRFFTQTAYTLVNALDAKDKFSHGHSGRVAEYSAKIAEFAGKSPSECEEIYYIALLHDVGMLGISESIVNKEGRLTEEEFESMKGHTDMGAKILQDIAEYPYISIGARFHHERYDGKGYPRGLKGTDIPEIARIIAVADAYDAMTSKRGYREPFPQTRVREELIECSGTQFDPVFAGIMIHLIDLDTGFEMREHIDYNDVADSRALVTGQSREEVSEGILINSNMATIGFRVTADKKNTGIVPKPSIILYDSLDGLFHEEKTEREEFLYYEYAEINYEGKVSATGARKAETKNPGAGDTSLSSGEYRIEAVRIKDHALIRMINRSRKVETVIALPDSSRFSYMGITGEHCRISGVVVDRDDEPKGEGYIQRIAEEISYIDVPAGDVPNVQVDGYRTASSAGIPIRDGLTITFHTVSLPTARLVWHCPSYFIYSSKNGEIDGDNYKEYSYVRLDGETWEVESDSENELIVDRERFDNWDSWRAYNREGFECRISFGRLGNRIISSTDNCGIAIRNITDIKVLSDEVYVALSGDQCALTNIRIGTEDYIYES